MYAAGYEANARAIAKALTLPDTAVQALAAGAPVAKDQPATAGVVVMIGPDLAASLQAVTTTTKPGATATTVAGRTATTATTVAGRGATTTIAGQVTTTTTTTVAGGTGTKVTTTTAKPKA